MKITWLERIEVAEKSVDGEFTLDDKAASNLWSSCAVAEVGLLNGQSLYEFNGAPKDFELQGLGTRFSGAVYNDDIKKAKEIYQQIVERSNANR